MALVGGELPSEFLCPITHGLMRDPVRASDGHVYERLAIERWFAQRQTSPMNGTIVTSVKLESLPELQENILQVAEALRDSPDGQQYFSCPYCNSPPKKCPGTACKNRYERQLRSDANFGAAARRRRWIEGTLVPSAERVLRSGPVAAGALMVGAFSVGAVWAVIGGAASSVAQVVSGGFELCTCAFQGDEDDPPSISRGCFKIASGAVLVPVASVSVAAMFAVGVAAGSLALATGVVNELANAALHTARLSTDLLGISFPPQQQQQTSSSV